MAPTYYSAIPKQDPESLLQGNGAEWRFSRAAYIAALCGMVCAAGFVHSTPFQVTDFSVQPRSAVPSVRAPVTMAPAARPTLIQKVGNGLAAFSLATMANLGTPYIAPAAELDVLSAPTPTSSYVYDDGRMLARTTVGTLESRLPEIEQRTGYRINVVTLRKLVISDDAFQFADKLIETWYPTAELGDKKAVLVIVRNSMEGGLVGGPSFNQNVPVDLVESIVNDNFGKLLAQEKFNQAVESTVTRLEAVLSGAPDPGPPKVLFNAEAQKQSQTFKTKEETDEKRQLYSTIFGVLVVISFVVPMVQYFAYTKDDS